MSKATTDSYVELVTKISSTLEIYAEGICYMSVCTSLPLEEAERELNILRPTGISSKWKKHDGTFSGGEENPCPCPDKPGHLHYLFSC